MKKMRLLIGIIAICFIYSAVANAAQIKAGVYTGFYLRDAQCSLKVEKITNLGGSSLHLTYASNTLTREFCWTGYWSNPYYIIEGMEYGVAISWDDGAGPFICKTGGVCETSIYRNYSQIPIQVSRITLLDDGNLILQNFSCPDSSDLLKSQDKSKCNFNSAIYSRKLVYATAEDLPAKIFELRHYEDDEKTFKRNCALAEKKNVNVCLTYRGGYHKRCSVKKRILTKHGPKTCAGYFLIEGHSK